MNGGFEVMKKQLIKVLSVFFICLIFITSFCLPAFAAPVSDLSYVQHADIIYDFDLQTALDSLSDFNSSNYTSIAYIGSYTYPDHIGSNVTSGWRPVLQTCFYQISFDSSFGSSVPLSSNLYFGITPWFWRGWYVSDYDFSFFNKLDSTVYFRYFYVACLSNGEVVLNSSNIIPISGNSSYKINSFASIGFQSSEYTITLNDFWFDASLNTPYYLCFCPLTTVGLGSNGVSSSSGVSSNLPSFINGMSDFILPYSQTFTSYGSLNSSYFSQISNVSSLPDNIGFNFTVNGNVVNDDFGNISVLSSSPSEPDNPSGGSTSGSSSGSASGSYDSSTGDINVDVNLEQDYSPLIDYGDSEEVPSISDSSADEFESAVSDLPSIQDDDLDTVFDHYGFDSDNSAIRWIYYMINTLFNGNQKVFSVLLSFLVLSLLMLILNKRGQ